MQALNRKTVWSCRLYILKVYFINGLKDHNKRACRAAKGFVVVAPEQAWEKVFSAVKFWPFKTKMVKGTLYFIIKYYNKALRLGTANICQLCPRIFQLKSGLQESLGWAPALGHSTSLLPCASGHCQCVFLDWAPYNTRDVLGHCSAGAAWGGWPFPGKWGNGIFYVLGWKTLSTVWNPVSVVLWYNMIDCSSLIKELGFTWVRKSKWAPLAQDVSDQA